MPASLSALPAGSPRVYRAGTLTYTLRGVVRIFVLLLLGDFCAMIFESVIGPFMPLYLKQFNASNSTIALLTNSTAGLMNLLFLPNLSMWSDRTRTRWGRRIPFLIVSAPATVVALVLISFAPEITAALRGNGTGLLHGFSVNQVALGVLAVLIVLWHFFNLILLKSFNFLLRDVVPMPLMPRFIALLRVAGTGGHFAFQWFLFQYMMDHPKALFLGIGFTFLLSFGAICWLVREGQYPPPEPVEPQQHVLSSYLHYFRDCFSVPLYRNYAIAYAIVVLGTVPVNNSFLILFARQSLTLSMDAVGKITACGTIASTLLFLPMGYLCEKFHPFRVALWTLGIAAVVRGLAFVLANGESSWLVFSVLIACSSAFWNLASLSLTMQIFPFAKFGQFSSGLDAIAYSSLIVTSYLLGLLIDATGDNYRIVLLVSLFCYGGAIFPMLAAYRAWQRYGGAQHYTPPLPGAVPTR